MGNILNDIVEEVNIKPNKSKLVLKWTISIAGSLIAMAFVFGQFKSSFFGRLDKFEETLHANTVATEELKKEMNARFDKIYEDGFEAFNDFQEYNNKQLTLIIDYGSSNKDLLKRVLEVNSIEKNKSVETQVQQAKNEKPQSFIKPVKSTEYISLMAIASTDGIDTTFQLIGATENYINKIDKNKYRVVKMVENSKNSALFDVTYKNK
jgi:hypothetical protein